MELILIKHLLTSKYIYTVVMSTHTFYSYVCSCTFAQNFALYGAAIGVASYARVDIGSLPISIKNR